MLFIYYRGLCRIYIASTVVGPLKELRYLLRGPRVGRLPTLTAKAWSGPGSWSPKHFMPGAGGGNPEPCEPRRSNGAKPGWDARPGVKATAAKASSDQTQIKDEPAADAQMTAIHDTEIILTPRRKKRRTGVPLESLNGPSKKEAARGDRLTAADR